MDSIIIKIIINLYLRLINVLIKLKEQQLFIYQFQLKSNEILLNLLRLQYENNIQMLNNERIPRKRRWVKKPTFQLTGWWEELVPQMPDDVFKEDFRINKNTFNLIVNKLKVKIEKQQKYNTIPVDKVIAIGLKVLGSLSEYREVAKAFGVGKTTVHYCFKRFLQAAMEILVPEFIRIPTEEEFHKIAQDFEIKWGYPMAVGAIDGCHFPISVPEELATDYYNYKCFHSIISLAICDANYKVWYVKSGIPGRTNDSGALQQTWLFGALENGTLLPMSQRKIENQDIPFHILGDGAFPMRTWLMKPFAYKTTTDPGQINYNFRHSRARRVIENVFGLVKARWRRTSKRMEIKLEDASMAIQVSFALHNICEEMRDLPKNDWPDEYVLTLSREINAYSTEANSIRDAIKEHFKKNIFYEK